MTLGSPWQSWTAERIETLARLWADGLSASQVAAELGGISRNAVISKVHRLGLAVRGKTEGVEMRMAMGMAPVVRTRERKGKNNNPLGWGANKAVISPRKQASPPPEPAPPPAALLLPLAELTAASCRWPIGEVGTPGFGFCGMAKPEDPCRPYCDHHQRLSRAAPSERTARALERLADREPLGR
jgi:GcrA cell cycle regulator